MDKNPPNFPVYLFRSIVYGILSYIGIPCIGILRRGVLYDNPNPALPDGLGPTATGEGFGATESAAEGAAGSGVTEGSWLPRDGSGGDTCESAIAPVPSASGSSESYASSDGSSCKAGHEKSQTVLGLNIICFVQIYRRFPFFHIDITCANMGHPSVFSIMFYIPYVRNSHPEQTHALV